MSALKAKITEDMKQAMRDKNKDRLKTIRLALAAFKQKEVDERIELTDQDTLAIIEKMVKQRKESIRQYDEAGRDDLSAIEHAEIDVLKNYLPEQLSEEEVDAIIDAAMNESGASSMQQMGQVMGLVKPQVQGRADMGAISQKIKAKLA